MKSFPRADRIGSSVQRGVSEILRKGLGDPRLDMATITGVKVSRDLGVAYVYYVIPGDTAGRDAAAAGFRSAEGFIKRSLAGMLKMKYMPDIRFRYDESFAYGQSIDTVLRELQTEKDDVPDSGIPPEDD
jgi:ribosome-binding factor A